MGMYVCLCVYLCVYKCSHVCPCMFACVSVHVRMCVSVCSRVCPCMFLHVLEHCMFTLVGNSRSFQSWSLRFWEWSRLVSVYIMEYSVYYICNLNFLYRVISWRSSETYTNCYCLSYIISPTVMHEMVLHSWLQQFITVPLALVIKTSSLLRWHFILTMLTTATLAVMRG